MWKGHKHNRVKWSHPNRSNSTRTKRCRGSNQQRPQWPPSSRQHRSPPRQDSRVDSSILQTPQRENVNRKRDRETPLTASPEKRQRLNPFSEEEMPSMEASASSFQQEQDRAALGEVSSSGQQQGTGASIKQQFKDAKRRSEPIKIRLYNHLLNMVLQINKGSCLHLMWRRER